MPKIPTQLPKEITDKYSIISNAFKLDKIKNPELDKIGEPKDEINVIIGDDKQPDKFYPQIKLQRWTNEVNFSVRLIENEIGEEKIETIGDKIKWSKGNLDVEFYDYEEGEGGYKFIPYLKKKPIDNVISRWSVKKKGCSFYKQPEITDEEAQEQLDIYNAMKAKGRPTEYTDEEIIRYTTLIAQGKITEFPPLLTEEEWQAYIDTFPTTLLEVSGII